MTDRDNTNHDAAPAARARTDSAAGEPGGGHGSDRTDKAVTRPVMGTGDQTAPPCVETDGSSPAIAQSPASSNGSGEGRPLDVPRPDTKGKAAGGRGHHTTDLIDRLRDRCYASKFPDHLLEQAADELSRLRGEVALWRSAATLTPEERRVMVNAICELEPAEPGRRLRHLYERLTHEVPE